MTSGYGRPETLGVDRWMAILAAWDRVQVPCVVVDAGSALTIDFIAAGGRHLGGYIVPGIQMMLDALYGGTADVRVEGRPVFSQLAGGDTITAVHNGCSTMAIALIEKSLNQLEDIAGSAMVVLTGGDSEQLAKALGDQCLHVPDLVLVGLGIALP